MMDGNSDVQVQMKVGDDAQQVLVHHSNLHRREGQEAEIARKDGIAASKLPTVR